MKKEIKELIEHIDSKITALEGAYGLYKQQGQEKDADAILLVGEAYSDVRDKLRVIIGEKPKEAKIIVLKKKEDGN